jgi:hypothetical protein
MWNEASDDWTTVRISGSRKVDMDGAGVRSAGCRTYIYLLKECTTMMYCSMMYDTYPVVHVDFGYYWSMTYSYILRTMYYTAGIPSVGRNLRYNSSW